jgi:hypothetical protein
LNNPSNSISINNLEKVPLTMTSNNPLHTLLLRIEAKRRQPIPPKLSTKQHRRVGRLMGKLRATIEKVGESDVEGQIAALNTMHPYVNNSIANLEQAIEFVKKLDSILDNFNDPAAEFGKLIFTLDCLLKDWSFRFDIKDGAISGLPDICSNSDSYETFHCGGTKCRVSHLTGIIGDEGQPIHCLDCYPDCSVEPHLMTDWVPPLDAEQIVIRCDGTKCRLNLVEIRCSDCFGSDSDDDY